MQNLLAIMLTCCFHTHSPCAVQMLANHYPERLYKAYICNAPSIFSLAYKVRGLRQLVAFALCGIAGAQEVTTAVCTMPAQLAGPLGLVLPVMCVWAAASVQVLTHVMQQWQSSSRSIDLFCMC